MKHPVRPKDHPGIQCRYTWHIHPSASRLLNLSENARHLLHLAAIIGREFDFELAKQVAPFPETDTLDAVEELQAAHLIKPLAVDKFTFDHSLTMQVSLIDMSETRRRFLHRHIAETMEEIFRNDLDPVSGLIAHHYMDGGVPDRAKSYAFRAGELEVLQLITEGLTNPEIAGELYFSLNTLKVHSRNIYSKLGVHNQLQTVGKAQGLG